MSTENGDEQLSVIRELQKLNDLVQQVTDSLKSQKEILKRRGMNLPPMVLTTLGAVNGDLKNVENNLIDEQTELGQLRVLADMSAKVNTTLDVNGVLEETMDVVITLTRAERGYIVLKDAETGDVEFRISRDDSVGAMRPTAMGGSTTPQISMSVLNEVLDTGEPLLADNAYKDERLGNNMSIANMSLRSVLCVPLSYKDQVVGAVYVDNRLQAGVFTEREKNLLTAFANTAAVAFSNAQLYQNIQNALAEILSLKDLMDNVFASIASGVVASDAEDVVTTFNRAAAEILSQNVDETIGRKLSVVLPKITADIGSHLKDVRSKGESQTLEAEFTDEKRGRVAVNVKLSPLKDDEQNTQGIALVVDDVTEKRSQDQEMRVMRLYLPPQMVDNIHTISNLALGGERRTVTCIFADVRPLITMKELSPREKMDLLNTYLAVATDCIHEAQGVVDKYMGNEVMALFNTQLNPMENHAEHAIDAALLMRERFIELYQQLGINPDPHYYIIGMHSGIATLGNVGSVTRRDFTAIGDTINLSKRVEENASMGQIVISEDTYQSLIGTTGDNHGYQFDALEPISAKGRTQKTPVYSVFKA